MIFKYRFRGSEVEINTTELVRTNPYVRRLKVHLDRVAGTRAALADEALAGFVARVIHVYGESYFTAVSGALETIYRARGEITAELDKALQGELPDFARVKQGFDDIDLAFPEILSPQQAANKAPTPTFDAFIGPRKAPPSLADVFGRIPKAVARLTSNQSAALERAERVEGTGLRRAITAEAEESLTALRRRLRDQHGWSEAEANELIEAVEALNKDWRAQNDPKVAADARAALEPEIHKLPKRLQAAVRGSKVLQDLLHTNPSQLDYYWERYTAKFRPYGFGLYVFFNMLHVKGHLGEFGAAFDLGEALLFLKGPKGEVTTPGTDLVGIDPATGEVLFIDNKAVKARLLSKVSALTRNIVKNLADDVAEFRAGAAGREMAPNVEAVLRRLERASDRLARLTREMSQEEIDKPETQAKIAEILQEHGIRRVVTNAGGKLEALSRALDAAGIELENLNEPVEP
jgi:hypothetical protein